MTKVGVVGMVTATSSELWYRSNVFLVWCLEFFLVVLYLSYGDVYSISNIFLGDPQPISSAWQPFYIWLPCRPQLIFFFWKGIHLSLKFFHVIIGCLGYTFANASSCHFSASPLWEILLLIICDNLLMLSLLCFLVFSNVPKISLLHWEASSPSISKFMIEKLVALVLDTLVVFIGFWEEPEFEFSMLSISGTF